mgnify:CR=1 FL=1
MFLVFKKWAWNIQTADYNGARIVNFLIIKWLNRAGKTLAKKLMGEDQNQDLMKAIDFGHFIRPK